MARHEACEARHGSMDSRARQLSAHPDIVAVRWDCPDHVGWINVLQSRFQTLLFAVVYNFVLEEGSDVLNKHIFTGSLGLPD